MSRSKLELFVNPFPTFIVLACVSFQVIFGFELNVYLFQVVSVDFPAHPTPCIFSTRFAQSYCNIYFSHINLIQPLGYSCSDLTIVKWASVLQLR